MSFSDQQTWAGLAGGTANAITLSIPDITTLADLVGVDIKFIVATTNTGAVTITAGSTPPKPLLKAKPNGLGPLTGSELIATNPCSIIYDGTEYVVNSPFVLASVSASTNMQIFISSGTYTPTAGKRSALVLATGAGGSAGCAGSVNNAQGGWAGGTAVAYVDLAAISTVAVTIGAGGAQQNTATINGNNGGTTSFGSYAVATGGPGGWGPAGAVPVSPGVGTIGQLRLAGNAGQFATGGNQGGLGGGSYWGGGGAAGTNTPSNPTAGANGGGGGAGQAPGGPGSPGMAGGSGIVFILELT